jgi:hypothetical protein
MRKLFVVRHGIPFVGYSSKDGKPVRSPDYYLLSFGLESNVGYIGKKSQENWRLYTSIGAGKDMVSRYHHFGTFEECIAELQILAGEIQIEIFDIDTYYQEFPAESVSSETSNYDSKYLDAKLFIWLQSQYVYRGMILDDSARSKLRILSQLIFTQANLFPHVRDNNQLFSLIESFRNNRLEKLRTDYEVELITLRVDDIPNVE